MAAPTVALAVGLAGCRPANQTSHKTPSPVTSVANPADLVHKAGFAVNPGSESGRAAPDGARFANGQLSTAQGAEILSVLVFESNQARDAYAHQLDTASGPDFKYIIGDRLVAYLGAAHPPGPNDQDTTAFPLSPETIADRLGGTLTPQTQPPQPWTESPPRPKP